MLIGALDHPKHGFRGKALFEHGNLGYNLPMISRERLSSNRKQSYWISIGFWWVQIAIFRAKTAFSGSENPCFEVV